MIEDPYLDINRCVERLWSEYKKHPRQIVAVDFDETLYDWKNLGYIFPRVVKLVRTCQELGFYIVIFTASAPDRHEFIKNHCLGLGIKVDSINKNPIDLPYGNHGKIYYNILLCDRAGLKTSVEILEMLVNRIKSLN